MVVEDLSGLGQVAEEGVESVETLGAHDVGGSKDNDSSENIKVLSFLIEGPFGVKDSHDRIERAHSNDCVSRHEES